MLKHFKPIYLSYPTFCYQCVIFIDGTPVNPLSPTLSGGHQAVELGTEPAADEADIEKLISTGIPKAQNYLSRSVVALRSRVIPPPCIRNPYLKDVSNKDKDPYGNQRSKYAGISLVSRFETSIHIGQSCFFLQCYCIVQTM